MQWPLLDAIAGFDWSEALSDVVMKLLGFVLRLGLLLAGLVFFASLLAAGLVVLMLWLLRALWAKLTGQPVSPWTFQVNRQAVWQRFNQRGFGPRAASSTDNVVDVQAQDVTDVTVVTDVESKRIEPARH
ncbi:MAG: hypothetical protein AUJ20_13265 [Comamonadaceae bacterium CG1_02_60_18]|nr:MAG: hypothetical protein AUJ20_13265 [Comamonadaceae bacterium CG1_02_60_18]PIQ50923.1 MAG: hypothetical protein COW02_17255 [Comamonadaceae bacterium CG12_big_fil_rev_8_21_14_0_65_59_15]